MHILFYFNILFIVEVYEFVQPFIQIQIRYQLVSKYHQHCIAFCDILVYLNKSKAQITFGNNKESKVGKLALTAHITESQIMWCNWNEWRMVHFEGRWKPNECIKLYYLKWFSHPKNIRLKLQNMKSKLMMGSHFYIMSLCTR